ncbi:hypothetical protein ACSBR2_019042 [Camellia fascicularis]
MQPSSDKLRSKAMQIACGTQGVTSMALKGDSKDQVEEEGEQTCQHRSVEAVKPKAEENKEDTPTQLALAPYIQGYNPHPYYTTYYYY